MDTRVPLCGIELKNPVIPASGTFGYGREFAEIYDLDCLGSFCMKGTTENARYGNAAPRIYQMLENVEFCVVADPYLTPTAVAFADIFLPLKTTAERDSMRVWWQPLRAMKAITSFGECKSDEEVIVWLGNRLNPELFNKRWPDIDHFIQDYLDTGFNIYDPETGKSYFYIFNFLPYRHEFTNWTVTGVDAQYEPDNWAKAINSTNFRRAFLYAINPSVTLAVTAPEGYDNYKLHTITPPSFCANSKGVDYTECGGLASLSDFFDEAKAKEYRDAAVEELTAAGVTFPIKIQYPYNPAVVDWDKQCQVFKQQVEAVLNDGFDFISIIITQGPSDNFLNAVRRVGAYQLMSYYWGADYSDPETETDPFYQAKDSRGMRYAYLRTGVEDGFITGETADAVMAYMNAIEAAKQITDDIDARYKAFADAEALLITNALVIPRGMSVPAYLATRLNYWEGQYASTGFSNKRLKGIHVLDHYISMDEYEANRDAR